MLTNNPMKQGILVILLLLSASLPLKAANVITALAGVKAYPNPWRSDKDANMSIRFEGMPASSLIKLFTISGHLVKELSADSGGNAAWDRTNDSGHLVASGVYIYLIIDPQGNETSGKLAIIR
jgi:hypothetical protein